MASFFGSLAGRLGEGVVEQGEARRREKAEMAERMHRQQLAKMRMKHDNEILDRRIAADDKREKNRQDFEMWNTNREMSFEAGKAAADREFTMDVEELRAQTDIITEAMKQYFSATRTRTASGNGWNVKYDREQTIDPLSGQVGFEEIINATGPDGRPYRLMGDKAFLAGDPNRQIYPFQSVEQQRQAEGALYDGKVTAEQFMDDFGYVPSSYIFGRVAQDDTGFQNFMDRNNIRVPNMFGGRDRRSGTKGEPGTSPESKLLRERMDDDYEYEPGAEMRPSIEELSEGPARDAHIAAQGGKTNAQIAEEMRQQAQPTAGGGGRLTQGGQLDQPPVSPYGFTPGESPSAPLQFSDEDAAEIARQIDAGMNYQIGGTL